MQQVNSDLTIIVLDGFSMLSLAAIVEVLQLLSVNSNQDTITYELVGGVGAKRAQSRSGLDVDCARSIEELNLKMHQKGVFLCCGRDVPEKDRDHLRSLLRFANRQNIPIFGVDAAAWILADAGVLNGRTVAVHWDASCAFSERFPEVKVRNSLFLRDGNIVTCAGDLATVDMMMELLQTDFPAVQPGSVWNELQLSLPRTEDCTQPGYRTERIRHLIEPLRTILTLMDRNIEEPLSMLEISRHAGLSVRQIERLFARHLSASPVRYYRSLRLENARQLIEQTKLKLTDIAVATGFSTQSQLTKAFRVEFNTTPTSLRNSQRMACQ
ncbi:helix-turn-helix domain-containing protein [Rhodobacteraceae bacterium]|nr:helix-turn-helix domain-containing protein [Paracoccaceae bacterium]|tara:strand:- start:846 stop:1823 length:978 start_codon:yes stop_codon:yes gene_type:complete